MCLVFTPLHCALPHNCATQVQANAGARGRKAAFLSQSRPIPFEFGENSHIAYGYLALL